MKAIILLSMLAVVSIISTIAQNTIDLTFTAVDSAAYVQLSSIKIMNRTQGGDTVLYWPDTVLSFNYVGIYENPIEENAFQVYQNYPNPVANQTTISLYIPVQDKVGIIVTDILGRVVVQSEKVLHEGTHSFRFTPGNGNLYFFTARWHERTSSIKILNLSSGSNICLLDYIGGEPSTPKLKAMEDTQDFSFSPGDEMLYIGHAGNLQSGILDIPEESSTYNFQFATNIPCPGTPIVEYEGKVYNTIQVFSQCWLKENLNVGWQIPGSGQMSDNGFIEKYCYADDTNNCIAYGGLYQWDEMMQYISQPVVQGICPPGWHLPTDEDWKVLEGAVDSQYGIGNPEWDDAGWRGYDAGKNLKTTSGWIPGNGTDLFGFSGLPGGHRHISGYFYYVGYLGYWWSSTGDNNKWSRQLSSIGGNKKVYRQCVSRGQGFSARCLRDEVNMPQIGLTFTAVNNTNYAHLDSIKVMNRTRGGETMLHGSDTTLLLPIELPFTPGDELLCIGYTDTLQSGMLDTPEEGITYTFQFATNIPCPGTPTVEYEGQVYNTIQIFSQCWLKENLNVGTMILSPQSQSDNDTIEKYCYNNEPDSCTKYGGLYQWAEMMQYTTQQGAQGICPPGWHLPTDEEWKVLEGAVDSQYGIGDPMWNSNYYHGFDVGKNLKTTSGWSGNDNGTDLYGFSGLPGGSRYLSFYGVGDEGFWWTSTKSCDFGAWFRILYHFGSGVYRFYYGEEIGLGDSFSVRCLRGY
jgi:uncharacterized protein (TIGR02145 family)